LQFNFSTFGLIGAFIGFLATKRVFGAFIGYFIGSAIENVGRLQQFQNQQGGGGQRTYGGSGSPFGGPGFGGVTREERQRQFASALMVLFAEVVKADGKILKSELAVVKNVLIRNFGDHYAKVYWEDLKKYLESNNDISGVCRSLNQMMPPQQLGIVVQYLFDIAQSDGNVSKQELDVIERIARMLNISPSLFEQLKSMFWKDASNAYKVLGLEKSATDQQVKKAYRKMAVEHHPDKFATMGEQHQKAAKEQFQKIQEAYEIIKKERGI